MSKKGVATALMTWTLYMCLVWGSTKIAPLWWEPLSGIVTIGGALVALTVSVILFRARRKGGA